MINYLRLENFRSYRKGEFELHPDITLVVGPNASGKTNLLESLYVLSRTKSFRAKDADLVRRGESYYLVEVSHSGESVSLGFSGEGLSSEKRIRRNGVRKSLASHIGTVPVVLFEPSDLQLVSGPPEGRRRYLDGVLAQTDRAYLKSITEYKRILRQRNTLLSEGDKPGLRDELFGWDVQLAQSANIIYQKRVKLLQHINEVAAGLYEDIAAISVPISLDYQATVDTSDYSSAFIEELASRVRADLGAGFTTIGPHREDFSVSFKGQPINTVASRGEVRTLVLVLKLAELLYNESVTNTRPLLLLDDVFSELDTSRRSYLLKRLQGYQSVITTTDADIVMAELGGKYKLIKTV